jgi:hypothetical protein
MYSHTNAFRGLDEPQDRKTSNPFEEVTLNLTSKKAMQEMQEVPKQD